MSSRFYPSSLRRVHQLKGTAGMQQPWALAGQNQFSFDDVPLTMVALGRKHVLYTKCIRLQFKGAINSVAGTLIPRKVLTPMLIASVQVQGTEIGTPVSSTHMLGGIIDTNAYLRAGGENPLFNQAGITLAANTPKPLNYAVDIYVGNFSQSKGHQTCPLALFMKPGEILVNTPQTLAGVDASLTDVTFSTPLVVTAHMVLIPSTELLIANPWQMTRHKSNAASGTDSVAIQSFGANSTLTGVQSKAGVHSLLWASSDLIGNAQGSGHVRDIVQFAADFLGLRQNNDPRAIVQEMFEELSDGQVINMNGADDRPNPLYPFFDLESPAITDLDVMASAEFFPILYPVRQFDASKLLDAVGNPSYDLTGVFAGPNHYTYCDAVYPFTGDKLNDLLAVIQRNHIGLELYGTDDLVLSTKMADNSNPMSTVVSDPAKLTYLPRIVLPRANPAVK
jgi:hypothetical protein